MTKLWAIFGALMLILEISALPNDPGSKNSPSVYALGVRRYRGSTSFRNPSSASPAGSRERHNITANVHRHRNLPTSSLEDQMKGKAIFFANPDVRRKPIRESTFARKVGNSLKLGEKTINDTIQEVEEMMKANPHLPRLSREQMIDIIENITNSGPSLNGSAVINDASVNGSREDYIRSLMLVMPFNTNNLSDSMIQELYTKPPITEIINTTPSTPQTTEQWRIVVGDVTKEPHIVYSKGTTLTTTEPTTGTTTQKPYSSTFSYTIPRNTEKYRNRVTEFGSRQRPKINIETTQRTTTTVEDKINSVPRYRVRTTKRPFTSTEEHQSSTPRYRIRTTRKPTTVFQYPEATLARIRAKTTTAPFIVTATSVTARPFKRIPEQVTIPSPLTTESVPIREDVKELLASLGLFPVDQASGNGSNTARTPPKNHMITTTSPTFPVDVKKGADKLSPEMQTLLKSFGLLDNEIPLSKETSIKQTTPQPPTTFEPPPPEPTVDIESYAAFKPLPNPVSLSSTSTNKSKYKMGDDMKGFLASFGLIDMENGTITDQASISEENTSRKSNYRSRGRKYDEIRYNQRRRYKKKGQNSTTPLDLSIDTDMLPDEMKGVLKALGLDSDLEAGTNAKNSATNASISETTPIPSTNTTSQNITTTTSASNDATTESILTTTISTRTTKRVDNNVTEYEIINNNDTTTSLSTTTTVEGNSTTEGHIFNPKDTVPNTEDIEHLNKLLKTVRLLANGTTPEELEYILGGDSKQSFQSDDGKQRKEKMTSLEEAKNPPDPLSIDELVHILNEAKNEVKRQESNVSASTSTTNATSQSITIAASESNGSPSVEDLAASFGGTDDEEEEAELPPPSSRPNGLYFLLDWNSFLEVGEDNSRVNLRFAPKLGDSRNFLPVTVP